LDRPGTRLDRFHRRLPGDALVRRDGLAPRRRLEGDVEGEAWSALLLLSAATILWIALVYHLIGFATDY